MTIAALLHEGPPVVLCKFLQEVLKQLNQGLAACGKETCSKLPLGILCHPRRDVIGRTLAPLLSPRGEPVGEDRITVLKEHAESLSKTWKTQLIPGRPNEITAEVLLTKILKKFRRLFDRNKFPELVEQSRP